MLRTEQSERVHDYVLNKSHIHQYGSGVCNDPPTGLNCKTTFEQSNVIDVDTFLRNSAQSFAVTPKSSQHASNISTAVAATASPVVIPEWNLRESKSVKTISKVENGRWNEPTPESVRIPALMNVNQILGIDTRQFVKYGANL